MIFVSISIKVRLILTIFRRFIPYFPHCKGKKIWEICRCPMIYFPWTSTFIWYSNCYNMSKRTNSGFRDSAKTDKNRHRHFSITIIRSFSSIIWDPWIPISYICYKKLSTSSVLTHHLLVQRNNQWLLNMMMMPPYPWSLSAFIVVPSISLQIFHPKRNFQ